MRSLIYIIVLLVITGCSLSSHQQKILDEAQSLVQSDPSAALSKLNGLDVSELPDSATIARWALLYSEALAGVQIASPTDTIVDFAIDYYGSHNFPNEFRKAKLLKSTIKSSGTTDALASALYLQKEKELLLYKERVKREEVTLIGIIILLTAVGVILWMRQRIKIQSLQNETLMAEMSGLKNSIDLSRGDVGKLEMKLKGLLDNRFSLIDSLCQTYYETQGTITERRAIVDKVKNEIDLVRTDSFPKIESVVNDCRDNILVKLKESYPDIKPEDYRLLVYLAGGLSTRTISLLMEETVEVIYKRKSRLKGRIKERVEPFCPEIMAIF